MTKWNAAKGHRRAVPARPATSGWWTPCCAAFLVLAGAATYWNGMSGPFVFDDDLSIVTNAQIRQLWPPSTVFRAAHESAVASRPLVALSFALNYWAGGLDVGGYHAGNIAIHVLCALLLYGIVRRTLALPGLSERFGGRAAPLGCACALLWMLHPLQTDVVDYVTQRTESLMALCYLSTVYAALRATAGTGRAGGWQVATVAACAMGMASKESMITAPVMVLLYDAVFVSGSIREAIGRHARLHAGLAATWVILPVLAWTTPYYATAGLSTGIRPWTYLLNQSAMIVRYLRLVVWPDALVLDYGVPRPLAFGDVAPEFAFVAMLVLAAGIALRVRPRLGFLGAWFFVTLAPSSSFMPIATEVGAERRMYLPLAAVAVLAVLGGDWARTRIARAGGVPPRVVTAASLTLLMVVSLGLAGATMRRNREYASGVSIAGSVVERWPHGRAHHLYAVELMKAGRRPEALAELREAVREDPTANYSLGLELVSDGRLAEGVEHLSEFVRMAPGVPEAVSARGAIVGALTDLAIEQTASGRRAEAISTFRRAVMADPQHTDAHRNLAKALEDAGDFEGAAGEARQALALAPGDPALHNLLGVALASSARLDEAVVEFQRSVAIDPAFDDARRNLALAERQRAAPRAGAR